jgi:nucleoside-diphosphate-sugar epimerase
MAVKDELVKREQHVRLVNRRGQVNEPTEVEVVQADATDPSSMRAACQGASVIYHCAKAPYTQWPEQFPALTEGVIDAAAHTGATLVYGDNLYMYGKQLTTITEQLPYAARGKKGLTRAHMSSAVLRAHQDGRIQATIGRASDFYGPRVLDSALGERVFAAALQGKPAELLGNIDQPHTYTYIRDYASGLVELGENARALGAAWHIPSAQTVTTREIVSQIYHMVGREPKFLVAPKFFVSVMALFNANMRESKEMLYLFENPFVVAHNKYEDQFGAQTTPHDAAISETIAWFRTQASV